MITKTLVKRSAGDELKIAERRVLRLEVGAPRFGMPYGAGSDPCKMACIAKSVETSLKRVPKNGYETDKKVFELAERTKRVLGEKPDVPDRIDVIRRLSEFQRQRMAAPESMC